MKPRNPCHCLPRPPLEISGTSALRITTYHRLALALANHFKLLSSSAMLVIWDTVKPVSSAA